MTASKYMSSVVQTVSPRATLKDAAQILFEQDCGMIAVVDGGDLKAVLTDRDICIIACNHNRPLGDLVVGDVIKEQVFSCAPDDELTKLLGVMSEHHVRRLPVVGSDGALQGVITFDDLARASNEGALEAAEFVKALVAVTGSAQTAS